MDASGSPESCGAVAWKWIEDRAGEIEEQSPGKGHIEISTSADLTTVIVLYCGTEVTACATMFRDTMNFTTLIRWANNL